MPWLRPTELDRTTMPELAARIALAEEGGLVGEPRRYPGYPTWPLPRPRRRWWPSLDRVFAARRCPRRLGVVLPPPRALGRILFLSHGVTADLHRGPTPSAGGLQALELYLAPLAPGWLPAGAYHYDRRGHHLTRVIDGAERGAWAEVVPSLRQLEGGAVLWVLAGDWTRVAKKYGDRGERFLLLEAGHLMQNLCLASVAVGLATVPLGGVFEREVARVLRLPPGDRVLYAGLCGTPAPAG